MTLAQCGKLRWPLIAVLTFSLSACGGQEGRPETAATVAGRSVPSAEVERLTRLWMDSELRPQSESHASELVGRSQARQGLAAEVDPRSLPRDQVTRLVLEYLIRRALLEERAAEEGIDLRADPVGAAAAQAAPDKELVAAGWDRPDIEQSFKAGRLAKSLAEVMFPHVDVSEAEVQQRYERQPEVFERSWRATVKTARFDDPGPVGKLRAVVRTGEAFEAAAARLGSKETLNLGTVNSVGPLPERIRSVLDPLQAGTVSEAVTTNDGGVIAFFVEHREDLPALSVDEVRPVLKALIADEKRQELFDDWFDDELRTAPIEVARHYGRWDQAAGRVH